MRTILLLALLLGAAAADAQEPNDPHAAGAELRRPMPQPQQLQMQPQGFVPYEITERDSTALLAALGEVPAKYSIPILNFLQEREQRAVLEAQADQRAAAAAAAQAADKDKAAPRLPFTPTPTPAKP
jgi:hypothetical protein